MEQLLHVLGLCGEHTHFSIIGTTFDILQTVDLQNIYPNYFQNLKLLIKSKTN